MKIIKRFFKSPKSSYFLFGPRGTGKTTWLKKNCKNELTIDLLEPGTYRRYKARPERLRELVEGNPEINTFIIDEIQKVPEILDIVHALIEEKPGHQFVLTGSSARKIKQKGVDLLGGRAIVRSLHPFTRKIPLVDNREGLLGRDVADDPVSTEYLIAGVGGSDNAGNSPIINLNLFYPGIEPDATPEGFKFSRHRLSPLHDAILNETAHILRQSPGHLWAEGVLEVSEDIPHRDIPRIIDC